MPSLPTTLESRSNSWVISSFDADDFVEEAGDLAVDAVDFFGQANGEIAAAQRPQRADELAAIDEFPRGLDVHWFTPVATLPPPVVEQRRPPGRRTDYI